MEPLTAEDPVRVGGYRLEARLGSGGMGQVFLGSSLEGRAVAVKVVHGSLAADQAFRVRFRREVAAAQAVSGAYTASVVAAGPDDDPPWMATEFVEGPSLWQAVTSAGPLPVPSVWRLAAGLVEALQAVHSCGLVHRDLKPQNVLLSEDGPRLIDFGVCQALGDSAVTGTGLIVGTPPYMSPEQAKGKRAGAASDVFSLGCVLAFAATGTPPYGNGQPAAVLYRIVHAAPALGGLEGELHDLIAACLAKPATERPSLSALFRDIATGGYGADQDAAAPALAVPAGAGAVPEPSWPDEVVSLIRDHQRPVESQISAAAAEAPNTVTSVRRAEHPAAAQWSAAAERDALMADWSAEQAAAVDSVAGQPAAVDSVASQPSDPAGSGVSADDPSPDAPPARPDPHLTRRRVLLGLSGAAAAGLAVLVREQLGHRTVAVHPAASPGVKGSTAPGPSPDRRVTAARRPGGLLWTASPDGGVRFGPAITSGVACVAANDVALCALDAASGQTLWRQTIPGGSITWSLAAADGTVYIVGNDGVLYALRALNGVIRWKVSGVFGGPSLANGAIYIASSAGSAPLYALRTTDGARLWRSNAINGGVVYASAAGGFVFATGSFGSLSALRPSDGNELWTTKPGGGTQSNPVAAGGVVYVTGQNNRMYAIRATDGTPLWSTGDIGQMVLPAAAGGTVYVVDNNGHLAALRARDGRRLWGTSVGGGVAQGPVAAGSVVYMVGSDGNLYAVNAGSGAKIWKTAISGGAMTVPVAAGNAVYVAAAGNRLDAVHA
ncbi:MAG TPA: serine/threonine-protein kinase [Streptosporangiaceae bacterium]